MIRCVCVLQTSAYRNRLSNSRHVPQFVVQAAVSVRVVHCSWQAVRTGSQSLRHAAYAPLQVEMHAAFSSALPALHFALQVVRSARQVRLQARKSPPLSQVRLQERRTEQFASFAEQLQQLSSASAGVETCRVLALSRMASTVTTRRLSQITTFIPEPQPDPHRRFPNSNTDDTMSKFGLFHRHACARS